MARLNVYKPAITAFYNKKWGSETWLANNSKYCGKILYLKHGYRCSIHNHKKKDETFYILSGCVWMEWDGRYRVMYAGDALRIKPGVYHRFHAFESDAQILEISTQHFDSDSYRKTKSEKVTKWKKLVIDKIRKWRGIDTHG